MGYCSVLLRSFEPSQNQYPKINRGRTNLLTSTYSKRVKTSTPLSLLLNVLKCLQSLWACIVIIAKSWRGLFCPEKLSIPVRFLLGVGLPVFLLLATYNSPLWV